MSKPKYEHVQLLLPKIRVMAENFFSILKTEYIYRRQAATFEDARTLIDNYIYFYNNQRI